MSTLKTASVLAFERNLDISDAFFAQINSANEKQVRIPVSIVEKSVRGTISNRLKNAIANDPVKMDAAIEKANLQKVDAAALNENYDTLVVTWSCKVLPFTGKPSICNNQDYQAALEKTVQDYLAEHGVTELAKRYASNIANARWLWRNRVGAEQINVTVRCKVDHKDKTMCFENAQKISLKNFDYQDDALTELSQLIEMGLMGQAFIILYVEAKVIVGYGQEVYPSQELVLDTGKKKSKELYQLDGKAGMHSQKIGNAIRTIDTWYPAYPESNFPIAIEPYGAVTTLGTAFRQPKAKMDFYSIFDAWILKGNVPTLEQQHYVMGVLIRGGVFGDGGKE